MLRFFGNRPDKRYKEFRRELHPDWIYFLTDQQLGFVSSVMKRYRRASRDLRRTTLPSGDLGRGRHPFSWLLIDLRAQGARPAFVSSEPLRKYIETGGISLAGSFIDRNEPISSDALGRHDAILIDDPASPFEIQEWAEVALGAARLMVVGFDPCQLSRDLTDQQYEALKHACDADDRIFRVCYRQKEALGWAALRVMHQVAESTPFLDEGKVAWFREGHSGVYDSSNDLTFPNPYGYERTYTRGSLGVLKKELARVKGAPRWSHATPLLVVVTCGRRLPNGSGAWYFAG